MTVKELLAALAGAPDDAPVLVVTNTLYGNTYATADAELIDGGGLVAPGTPPFVQIVLAVDITGRAEQPS